MTPAMPHDQKRGKSGASPPPPLQSSGEKILLPADYAGIDALIESCWAAVKSELTRQGYGAKKTKIHLSLHEALVNAWKHGNHQRPDLPVTFRWRFAEDFNFEVLDTGKGFPHRNRNKPFTPDRLTAESGRGLFIIKICSDKVCWEKDGRQIIVTFAHP